MNSKWKWANNQGQLGNGGGGVPPGAEPLEFGTTTAEKNEEETLTDNSLGQKLCQNMQPSKRNRANTC